MSGNESSSAAAIEQLLAKQEIYECILRYSRGIDRHDVDLVRSTFHPDATDDHGVELTVDGFVAMMRTVDVSRTWVHHIGNVLVELFGDVAFVETYWLANQAWEQDGERYVRWRSGRYADRFENRADGWKVVKRQVIDDWNCVQRVEEVIADGSGRNGVTSDRDPIYAFRDEVVRSLGTAQR